MVWHGCKRSRQPKGGKWYGVAAARHGERHDGAAYRVLLRAGEESSGLRADDERVGEDGGGDEKVDGYAVDAWEAEQSALFHRLA